MESKIQNLESSHLWNPESMDVESGIQRHGIRNPQMWNLESTDMESGIHSVVLLEYQFGFRPNCSTELAVTYFTDFIRKEADDGKATGTVFHQRHSIPSVIPFY